MMIYSNLTTILILIGLVLSQAAVVYAQTSAKSNTVVTQVGNADESQKPRTDIGGGVETKGFVFYCQADPRWNSSCNLDLAGCGPSSSAMIVNALGVSMTPPQMDALFRDMGARSCSTAGSTIPSFLGSSWFKSNGFTSQAVNIEDGVLDLSSADKFLKSGYLILASSREFPCPRPGYCKGSPLDHIFVVDQVDAAAFQVRVRDPINCRPEHPQEYDTNKVISARFPWLYAYAIKKT